MSWQNALDFILKAQTLIAAIVAAFIAWRFNKIKVELDKESFKRELFLKYNEKYDRLNDLLEALLHHEYEIDVEHQLSGGQSLDDGWELLFEDEPTKMPDWLKSAFDYLNLASEEYYWYKKGFIDEDVWRCWLSGMQYWHRYSFFLKKIVAREKERNSQYYQADFLTIFSANEKDQI